MIFPDKDNSGDSERSPLLFYEGKMLTPILMVHFVEYRLNLCSKGRTVLQVGQHK